MIPLKLETLLKGQVVEHDRVEYKKGWNPTDIIHTICAYANDFNNTNGGYIVIGVEEKRGRPILPPIGVDVNDLDEVQQEIFRYCNMIEPRYIPRIEIEEKDNKHIIYLWCPAGDSGPYTAPNDVLSKDKSDKRGEYWIKPASLKTKAKSDEISELYEKFNSVPFDDRINRKAKIEDISYGYIEEFISKSNSALLQVRKDMHKEDLLLSLEVANETDAGMDIRNIGILMFAERPDKLIPGAQIDIVYFHTPDREAGDFKETICQGPIPEQIRKALDYIGAVAVTEMVVKHENRPEASRFFTYPLAAIEEALVNAVFHKSYRIPEPVEVRIYTDEIKILNYPGPDKDIDMEKLSKGLAIPRRYRNRRIGEFLKEIDLSEKRATGITKILKALETNGSPLPEFETNDDRGYMITVFKEHEGFNTYEPLGLSAHVTTPTEEVTASPAKVITGVTTPTEGAPTGTTTLAEEVTTELTTLGGGVNTEVTALAEEASVWVTTPDEEVTAGVTTPTAGVTTEVTTLAGGVTAGVTTPTAGVTTEVTTLAGGVTTEVTTPAEEVTTWVTTHADGVTTWVTTPAGGINTEVTALAEEATVWVTTPNEEMTAGVTTPRDGVTDGETTLAAKLTVKEMDVIKLLKENPRYTMPEMAERLSVSRKTTAERIKSLKDKQAIRREGNNMSGYWIVFINEM